MRLALIPLLLLFAGCGATQTASSFGEVKLVLPAQVSANDAAVYFATSRTYDEGEGTELLLSKEGDADFRITSYPPEGCVTVMAIVPPDKLVLCVDEVILQDDRERVLAVGRALQRGYTQAQLEPDEAISAMTSQIEGADQAALLAELTRPRRPGRLGSRSSERWSVGRRRTRQSLARPTSGVAKAITENGFRRNSCGGWTGATPHLGHLDAAGADFAQDELSVDARFVQQAQRAVRGRRGRGVPELVGDEEMEMPVVVGIRLGVARDEQRGGVDVAVLVDAQVELEVGPVRRQCVEELLEFVRKRHDLAKSVSMEALPFDLDGLLGLLERLDGAEEAAVVRSALAAGYPRDRVLEELEREVRRRLAA